MKIMQKLRELYVENAHFEEMISYNYPSKDMLRKIYTKFKKIKPKKNEKGEPVLDQFLRGLEPSSATIEEVDE